MTARREQVDGVACRLLEQELRDQGLAVVGHLALDSLPIYHQVAASDRCRGMNSQLGPSELGCLEIALVLLDGLRRPLKVGRELIGRLNLGDRRLLVHGHLVKLGLRVADLQPVLQGRQHLGKRGDVPGVRLVGEHGLSGLGLVGLADEERGGESFVHGVVDLGGDLQARAEQDLGVAGRDLEDLDRAHRGDERERVQDPAGRGAPGGDHGAAQEGQAQHQPQHGERLEKVAGSLHAKQEPPPAALAGRRLVEGEVGHRGRRLDDGRVAKRVVVEAVAAGELDDVDEMAFQLRERQLHPPRGRRQAAPAALLPDRERGDGRQTEQPPGRKQAHQRTLGQLEQSVQQYEEHKRQERHRRGQDGSTPERERPPLEPGLPQPGGHSFCLRRHDRDSSIALSEAASHGRCVVKWTTRPTSGFLINASRPRRSRWCRSPGRPCRCSRRCRGGGTAPSRCPGRTGCTPRPAGHRG